MNAIQYAIDGTASRVLDGLLMLPVAALFVVIAIAAIWYVFERAIR